MRIAVFGAGAIGGYFGGRLAQAGHDVRLLARGRHLAAIQERGLQVRSILGDFDAMLPATDEPATIGPVDAVLFTVKSYDTDAAAARLPPLLGPETIVVSLQNGVDNEERIGRVVGARRVLGGVAYLLANVADPGEIVHTGGPTRVVVGELDGSISDRARRLVAAFTEAGIDAELSPTIRTVLWTKFVFICAQAGITAATRLPIGEIRDDPEAWTVFRTVADEVAALGRAEGVLLADDVVEQAVRLGAGLQADARSSLANDLAAGRRMELEALLGAVVHRSRERGLPAAASETLYAVLRPWARRAQAAAVAAP
jgi:2-dehydropantoate 2-reductase